MKVVTLQLTCICSSNTQGLIAGGLPGLFWSLVWCYTGQTFVVLSLAEMASMAPVRTHTLYYDKHG